MMKKILCFFMVALLAALLVVPCFAAETTIDRGDPVDWFGSPSPSYYTRSCPDGSELPSSVTPLIAVVDFSIGSTTVHSGDTYAFFLTSGNYRLILNGSQTSYSASFPCVINFPTSVTSYSSVAGYTRDQSYFTLVDGSSSGFVDAGFSDALTELSSIVSAILSNQYILIAIGLAVAVPLVAWGISKIKSLVKGY